MDFVAIVLFTEQVFSLNLYNKGEITSQPDVTCESVGYIKRM